MIKSKVLSKDKKTMHVSVTVEGEKEEIYTEIKGILDTFDKDPELTSLLVKAMLELLEKAKEV